MQQRENKEDIHLHVICKGVSQCVIKYGNLFLSLSLSLSLSSHTRIRTHTFVCVCVCVCMCVCERERERERVREMSFTKKTLKELGVDINGKIPRLTAYIMYILMLTY